MNGTKLIRNSTAEFLIFTGQAGEQSIEARYEDDTLWLSQKLMAELFGVDVRTVSEHLKNIFASHELAPEATIRKFRIVQQEGRREVSRAVVCRTGMVSAQAAKRLVKTGYQKVYWLDGGIGAWQAADLPLARGR